MVGTHLLLICAGFFKRAGVSDEIAMRKKLSPLARVRTGERDLIRDHRRAKAALLDRLADAEIMQGHIAQAERLAHRAEELREAAR